VNRLEVQEVGNFSRADLDGALGVHPELRGGELGLSGRRTAGSSYLGESEKSELLRTALRQVRRPRRVGVADGLRLGGAGANDGTGRRRVSSGVGRGEEHGSGLGEGQSGERKGRATADSPREGRVELWKRQ
jgi:hypothetical protein